MQTLEKDWDSYDGTIYTGGAATHGSANGGSGVILTTDPTNDPRVHRQCTIPTGKGRSSIKAEDNAVRTSIKLVQEDVSLNKMHIVKDSMSTCQRIRSKHPSQQIANSDESEIRDALVSLTNRGCHLTFSGAIAILASTAMS